MTAAVLPFPPIVPDRRCDDCGFEMRRVCEALSSDKHVVVRVFGCRRCDTMVQEISKKCS
jgi:hypothetical protein